MKITIPAWMRVECPKSAELCAVVNFALEQTPNMSLAEFAKCLDEVNKEESLKRVQAAEKRQFNGE